MFLKLACQDVLFWKDGEVCGVLAHPPECDIMGNEFKLQSYYYIHFLTNTFQKGMKPFHSINQMKTSFWFLTLIEHIKRKTFFELMTVSTHWNENFTPNSINTSKWKLSSNNSVSTHQNENFFSYLTHQKENFLLTHDSLSKLILYSHSTH